MDELLKAMAAIGFTPQDVILMLLLGANWRLSNKMDKRILRLEVINNIINKDDI